MDLPLWKKANSAPFLCQCFCSLEKLFFLLRMLPNTFFINLAQKSQDWEISNFSPKHWTNPSGKMQVLQLSHINVFKRKAIFVAMNVATKIGRKTSR